MMKSTETAQSISHKTYSSMLHSHFRNQRNETDNSSRALKQGIQICEINAVKHTRAWENPENVSNFTKIFGFLQSEKFQN